MFETHVCSCVFTSQTRGARFPLVSALRMLHNLKKYPLGGTAEKLLTTECFISFKAGNHSPKLYPTMCLSCIKMWVLLYEPMKSLFCSCIPGFECTRESVVEPKPKPQIWRICGAAKDTCYIALLCTANVRTCRACDPGASPATQMRSSTVHNSGKIRLDSDPNSKEHNNLKTVSQSREKLTVQQQIRHRLICTNNLYVISSYIEQPTYANSSCLSMPALKTLKKLRNLTKTERLQGGLHK